MQLTNEDKIYPLYLNGYRFQKRELLNTFRDTFEKTFDFKEDETIVDIEKEFFKLIENLKSPEDFKEFDSTQMELIEFMQDFYTTSVFEIDEKMQNYLLSIDNQLFERDFPFPVITLDCDIKIGRYIYKGITVFTFKNQKVLFAYSSDEKDDENGRFPIQFLLYKPSLETFRKGFYHAKYEEHSEKFCKTHEKNIKKLSLFVCNFLDFINNPEVEVFELKRSENNEKREWKKGKIPYPRITTRIKLSNKLRIFIDDFYSNAERHKFNHRFLVRGHFVRFWNKKKYRRLYDLKEQEILPKKYQIQKYENYGEIIQVFKQPHYKGEGMFVKKIYEVIKNRKTKEN